MVGFFPAPVEPLSLLPLLLLFFFGLVTLGLVPVPELLEPLLVFGEMVLLLLPVELFLGVVML